MSEKNLLNEVQIRKFMKLAQLEPLAETFVSTLPEVRATRPGDKDQGERSRGGHGGTNVPLKEQDVEDVDVDVLDAEEEPEEVEVEEPEEVEVDVEEEERCISVGGLLRALEQLLEDELETEVEIDQEEDVDLDVADVEEEPEEIDVEEEEDVVELQEGDDDELEEARSKEWGGGKRQKSKTDPGKEDYTWRQESAEATNDLVEQITKRVAARILKSALSEK